MEQYSDNANKEFAKIVHHKLHLVVYQSETWPYTSLYSR